VTQNPLDVPDAVLGQLSNRVQHALRAFTPRDQKAVKAAAETFRANPKLKTADVITQLAVGEALISFLDDTGTPGEVQRGFVVPPASRVGAITPDERQNIIQNSVLFGHYEKLVDRESAYERLKGRAESTPAVRDGSPRPLQPSSPVPQPPYPEQAKTSWTDSIGSVLGQFGGGGRREGMAEALAKSAARAIGSQVGRQIVRGVLGGILGGSASNRRRY
jgi:uncharacterized protein